MSQHYQISTSGHICNKYIEGRGIFTKVCFVRRFDALESTVLQWI